MTLLGLFYYVHVCVVPDADTYDVTSRLQGLADRHYNVRMDRHDNAVTLRLCAHQKCGSRRQPVSRRSATEMAMWLRPTCAGFVGQDLCAGADAGFLKGGGGRRIRSPRKRGGSFGQTPGPPWGRYWCECVWNECGYIPEHNIDVGSEEDKTWIMKITKKLIAG